MLCCQAIDRATDYRAWLCVHPSSIGILLTALLRFPPPALPSCVVQLNRSEADPFRRPTHPLTTATPTTFAEENNLFQSVQENTTDTKANKITLTTI